MNNNNSSSSFNSTHYLISFLTTALLFIGIIYWIGGCHPKDYSMNSGNAEQEAPHHEGGHH